MNRLPHILTTLLFIFAMLFANPNTVLASEGDGGNEMEVEVNGYHVMLTSQNEWAKGENTVVVTLADGMGMPVSQADVEIVLSLLESGHTESGTESQGSEQQNDAMAGMDMGDGQSQESSMPGMDMEMPAEETELVPSHEEERVSPIAMIESDDPGMYLAKADFESPGRHVVHVFFHVNDEMLQADFEVEIPGASSKTVILWSFATINVALVVTAGVMKKQKTVIVKGV
ncbi:MAG: hypothetical protein ACXW4M_04125 [Anaerolineales bacterium]